MYTSINNQTSKKDLFEFYSIIEDLLHNKTVQEMKKYKQHYNTSTFEHCLNVSYFNYKICKKLNLDYKSATRAGMLHDLFLYDWRNSRRELHLDGYHAFIHPKIALDNALKIFNLNKKEQDIILNHMWPVTLFSIPKCKESFIITLTDKYSAIKESFSYYKQCLLQKSLKTIKEEF